MRRTGDQDACPGALHTHQAADGPLARIRLPGGMIGASALQALAEAAARFGSGTLELTTRGNVQIRGITDPAALAGAVADAGLLPSATHERVRNIVASPLSGRVGGLADVRGWVSELDRALQADPELARLPGRFWFSIDDGSADVSGLAADAGLHVFADGVALLLAGVDTGVRLGRHEGVPALLTVARRFLEVRANAWRVSELADQDALLTGFDRSAAAGGRFPPLHRPTRLGWIDQDRPDHRVTLGAVVPLGTLSARQAEFVAAIDAPVVITPWRSLLVCDLTESVADTALRVLAPLGLVFDDTSPWLDVSACVGSPGCQRSRADVRAEATRVALSGTAAEGAVHSAPSGTAVHYVGCERACGSPLSGTVMLATGDGYLPLPRPTVG